MAEDVVLDANFDDFENQKRSIKKKTKSTQHAFTVRHDVATKVLLEKIKRIKELTEPKEKSSSQGSIVGEALQLLAKKMNLEKLEKQYSKFLKHINEDSVLNR